ncbi:hypothetical protein DFAR_3460075 [Desulfarculales bacterium]
MWSWVKVNQLIVVAGEAVFFCNFK